MERPTQEEKDALLAKPWPSDPPPSGTCGSCGLITYPAHWCGCDPRLQMLSALELHAAAVQAFDEAFALAEAKERQEWEDVG